jgi:hypothetical protein
LRCFFLEGLRLHHFLANISVLFLIDLEIVSNKLFRVVCVDIIQLSILELSFDESYEFVNYLGMLDYLCLLLIDQLIFFLVLLFKEGLGKCLLKFVIELIVAPSFLFNPTHSLSCHHINLPLTNNIIFI